MTAPRPFPEMSNKIKILSHRFAKQTSALHFALLLPQALLANSPQQQGHTAVLKWGGGGGG